MNLLRLLTLCLASVLVTSAAVAPPRAATPRESTLRHLPKSPAWEQWLERSREAPPNFDSIPSIPYLPDPLRFISGKQATQDEWPKRRQEILHLFQQYMVGTLPLTPGNVRVAHSRPHEEAGAFREDFTLEFGPEHQAKLRVELIIPKGNGPFPAWITSSAHRPWALMAVSRGYVTCIYSGAEGRDDTVAWTNIWRDLDWTTLGRRAWAASRCVDYLHTLPFIDQNKIALVGHGVDGKVALLAAAFDQRINATVVSSAGAGGVCSWRLFSEAQFGEGIELVTRRHPEWFHPRLRFFAGRENKLPIDQSQLLACVAPRACLIASARNDPSESIWAIEQSYTSARRAYDLFLRGEELNLLYRPGDGGTRGVDVETYLDWTDTVFRRSNFAFPDAAIYPTFAQWQQISGEKVEVKSFPTNDLSGLLVSPLQTTIITSQEWFNKREEIRARILWSLGVAPPFAESGALDQRAPPSTTLLPERAQLPSDMQMRRVVFGNFVSGDLYSSSTAARNPLPAVIWLHPISPATGYSPEHSETEAPHLALVRRGFAVLAFDQIGHGTRLEEVRNFYARYPHWSLLGKQVEDTLAAVETLLRDPSLDAKRIFVLGYGMGAMTALHAAALDDRIAGAVSVAGFTPMRLDGPEKGTGGIARWTGWLPLQPRLGAFLGREAQLPYDYHEVLAMIAPRFALIFTPRLDFQSSAPDVKRCVEEASKVFQLVTSRKNLQLHEVDDYNHFSAQTQQAVYQKLAQMVNQ